jgi:hypothetical protein
MIFPWSLNAAIFARSAAKASAKPGFFATF